MLHREVQGEALTGETDGPAIEPRNQESGMPMLLCEAKAIRSMALYASHTPIPRGRRPCARREVLRTETGRSQRRPVRKHRAEQERPKAVTLLFTSLRSRIRP
jgi:class 3 adenylate cyclase